MCGGLLTGDYGGVAVLLLVALLLCAEAFHEARVALGHQLPGDTRGRGGYIKQNVETPTDLIKDPFQSLHVFQRRGGRLLIYSSCATRKQTSTHPMHCGATIKTMPKNTFCFVHTDRLRHNHTVSNGCNSVNLHDTKLEKLQKHNDASV